MFLWLNDKNTLFGFAFREMLIKISVHYVQNPEIHKDNPETKKAARSSFFSLEKQYLVHIITQIIKFNIDMPDIF